MTLDQAELGWPDILDRSAAWQCAAPGHRLRGAQSTVGEVDFAAMDREAVEAAEASWERYDAARRAGQVDELQEWQIVGFTQEQYLLHHRWHPAHLVEHGRLHERGDLGLRVDIRDERAANWARLVDNFVARLPATTLLTLANCHT